MTFQPGLFGQLVTFDGESYDRERDGERLRAQLARVREVMRDGCWHTLADLAAELGDPEASISARLRDLRKRQFGEFHVEREYVSRGLWRYRLRL